MLLRLLQLFFLAVLITPFIIGAYKLINHFDKKETEIVMDPEQDDWEHQEQNCP